MPPHNYAASKSYFLVVLFVEQGQTRELRAIAIIAAIVDTSQVAVVVRLEVTTVQGREAGRAVESLG